jgi:hypothetical protein
MGFARAQPILGLFDIVSFSKGQYRRQRLRPYSKLTIGKVPIGMSNLRV